MSGDYRLGEHFERFVQDQLATGRYSTEGEVVQAGLRLLEEREWEQKQAIEDIKETIAADRRRGMATPADEVFERLETKIREKLGHS